MNMNSKEWQKWVEEAIATWKQNQPQWNTWMTSIQNAVRVEIVPRNTALRVEKTVITYIDDKFIGVYYEFLNYPGYNILNRDEANRVLGRGIAENYYVIQLSVVNKAEKIIAVRLKAGRMLS